MYYRFLLLGECSRQSSVSFVFVLSGEKKSSKGNSLPANVEEVKQKTAEALKDVKIDEFKR